MPILLLPLGTMVSTDARISIAAFQRLADKLGLGINIAANIKGLAPLFVRYNEGRLADRLDESGRKLTVEQNFEISLIKAIEALIPEDRKEAVKDKWQGIWKQEWKNAWTAMCQVDARAKAIAALLLEYKDRVTPYVYSDTNPTQFEFLRPYLETTDIDPAHVYPTFLHGNSIAAVIAAIQANCAEDIARDQCAIIMGNPEHIKEPALKEIGQQKEHSILGVLQAKIRPIQLDEPYLTVEKLQSILNDMAPAAAYVQSDSRMGVGVADGAAGNAQQAFRWVRAGQDLGVLASVVPPVNDTTAIPNSIRNAELITPAYNSAQQAAQGQHAAEPSKKYQALRCNIL